MNQQPKHEQSFDLDILTRYLDGYASSEDLSALKAWKEASADNLAEYEAIKALWASSKNASFLDKLEVDADWRKVNQALHLEKPQNLRKTRKIVPWAWGIAAGFALLFVALFILKNDIPITEVQAITLTDGTKVWYKYPTKINIDKRFGKEERLVNLDGEAYFEVAENAEKPFIISANNTEVKVLGTTFNVKSLPSQTEVTVTSGKVQFSKKDKPASKVFLTKGEKGVSSAYEVIKEQNKNPNFLAWKTGVFHFDNATLEQVVSDLSTYYGKTLQIKQNESIDCHLTADFEKEDLSSIISVLLQTCGIDAEEKENNIFLKARH